MGYALVMTTEVRAWLHDLRHRDRASAILVGQAISMLLEAGPELGRPLADRIAHSRLSNLKSSGLAQPDAARSASCTYSIPGVMRSCSSPGTKPGNGTAGTARLSRRPRNATRTT